MMEPSKYYHHYTHAVGSENLFRSDENYRYFLERYNYFANTVSDTHAYCLMPNHIHFLVKIKTESELIEVCKDRYPDKEILVLEKSETIGQFVIQQFAHLLNGYTQAYNKMYRRRGSLFVHSFKRKEIVDDFYLTSVITYIHNNPIHHGFVKELSSWTWSSFHTILSSTPTVLQREGVLKWFGNRDEFIKFHLEPRQPFNGFEPSKGFN
jgi:putative transposase